MRSLPRSGGGEHGATPADLLVLHAVRLTASAPVRMPNVSRPRPGLSLENPAQLECPQLPPIVPIFRKSSRYGTMLERDQRPVAISPV